MSVSLEDFLEQIQYDNRMFEAYSAELQQALKEEVKLLRRSHRAERNEPQVVAKLAA